MDKKKCKKGKKKAKKFVFLSLKKGNKIVKRFLKKKVKSFKKS